MNRLTPLANTIVTKSYTALGLQVINPYSNDYLNKIETAYRKYLQLQKDLIYMYTFRDKMSVMLSSKIFSHDAQDGLQRALVNFDYLRSQYIESKNLWNGGKEDISAEEFLKALNHDINWATAVFYDSNQGDSHGYMKKIDYILRFETKFKINYKGYNDDFETDGIFVPLDLETLRGESNNYGYYSLKSPIVGQGESKFKIENANLNISKLRNLNSYFTDSTKDQFVVNIGMYDAYRDKKVQTWSIAFNYDPKNSINSDIAFVSNKDWTSKYTKTTLTWHGGVNVKNDKYLDNNFVNFTDLFSVNSNWKVDDYNA